MNAMKRFTFTVGMVVLALGILLGTQVTPAAALPTINGTFSPATEWDGFFIQAFDGAEAGIADAYDMNEFRLINDASGIYMLLTTFSAPTLADQDAGATSNFAFVEIVFDYDGNGLFTDAVDRRLTHSGGNTAGTAQTMVWKDGTGATLLNGVEGTNFKLGDVYEYFIPIADGGTPVTGSALGFAFLDNGGEDADDRFPNSGFFTPVPEPGSLSLLGLGFLGLLGNLRRRRIL